MNTAYKSGVKKGIKALFVLLERVVSFNSKSIVRLHETLAEVTRHNDIGTGFCGYTSENYHKLLKFIPELQIVLVKNETICSSFFPKRTKTKKYWSGTKTPTTATTSLFP